MMRLVSFQTGDGRTSYGVVTGGGVIDLGARLPRLPTLVDALRAEALQQLESVADGLAPDIAVEGVRLLPPLIGSEKIICVGVNYANRNAEYRDDAPAPKYPSLFLRTPDSFVGHESPLVRPRVSHQLDYEGEIVLVIGRASRALPTERAQDVVAGLTIANDGTVRDWARHGKFNVTPGKNFDQSGAMGPWMVTASAIDIASPIRLSTRVNGELRQHATTADLIFTFADLVSYISTFTTLKPGDLILTGTPTGAGARFDPPRWLVPGDTVEVEVDRVGTLRNGVADEVPI